MNKTSFYLIIGISTVLIGYLIFGTNNHTPVTDQEIKQLSNSFGDKFAEMRESQQNKAQPPTQSAPPEQSQDAQNTQAIIGVIYKKENSTWFIKAKDNKKRIDGIAVQFEKYFLTGLKFDKEQQPLFNHLPKNSKITSSSSMRYATFMIDGVEVSIINLPGKQDIFSNVKRWMGQVGLNDKSPISMNFSDDKNIIFVKMPK